MKKLLTSLFLVGTMTIVFAQINQGALLIGGSLGLDFTNEKYKSPSLSQDIGKTTSFNVTPQVGYFIINNLAAGAVISLGSSSTKFEGSSGKYTSTTIIFAPFARYYFGNLFGEGQVGFGSLKDKTDGGQETKTNVSTWSIGGGYVFFVTDNVGIEPKLTYRSVTTSDNENSDIKFVDSGLAFSLGIQVYLNR